MGNPINFYDRFRFAVEDVHGNILTRDLVPMQNTIGRILSAPSQIELSIHPKHPSVQHQSGSGPIQFKPWGHWIHALKYDQFGNERIWASGLVQPSEVDPETGVLSLRATGFSDYPKGIPWLVNWNPIAVDPFAIVANIWNHIQSYWNGSLGVTTYPSSSGTLMLPGFSFNNEQFVQDFFAIFIRAIDKTDCGEYLTKLSQDIPFDYFEESSWNSTRTAIIKKIRLGYPQGGIRQEGLVFRVGENVKATTQRLESEVEWMSDIMIDGFFPGKTYSATISNADPDRYRRVMMENDLRIDSNERGAAWAKKRLTRRQFPYQYQSIIIDPFHPNAPFGTFDVGDTILVQGPMPWKGDSISQWHRVLGMQWDGEKGDMELQLMAEGAFNYDPIYFGTP